MLLIFDANVQVVNFKSQKRDIGLEEYRRHEYRK